MKPYPRAFATLAASLLLAATTASSLAAEPSTALKGKVEPAGALISEGVPAIAFDLQDLDGKSVTLESFKGKKAVILVFWSFFCGPCREEIPLLDEVVKKYAKDGAEMLAVNLDGPKMEKAVRKYMTSNGFGFRVLWEKIEGVHYITADAYGVAGTPTLVMVGKGGKVSWAHVGRAEAPKIEAELKKALAAE
ncbi:MAG: TlpA family protein disulfide reductase [Deltaproteobacteria bacterium]|nr:TlpA family protein disulfide reductase [Deltaproteobacteria bacterium]